MDLHLVGDIGNYTISLSNIISIVLKSLLKESIYKLKLRITDLNQFHSLKRIFRLLSAGREVWNGRTLTRRTGSRVNLNFLAPPHGVALLNPWNMSKYPILSLNSKIDFRALKRANCLSFFDKNQKYFKSNFWISGWILNEILLQHQKMVHKLWILDPKIKIN